MGMVFGQQLLMEDFIRPPHSSSHSCLVTFSVNHKKYGDKVTSLKLIFMWSIIAPGVCCNIPYFLAQYLASKVVTSRIGSPIVGGHFVTSLAK